jgi:acetyl esterase/lipase
MKFVWKTSTDGSAEALESIYVFPGKASMAQVARLPPTVVFTAEYDFYRPDGMEFAQKLKKAGKLLDYGDYGGCDHGFQFIKDAEYEKTTFIKDFTRLIKTYL